MGWICSEILGLLTLHYLYAAGVLFVVSAALLVGVSLATAPPDAAVVAPLLWRGSRPVEDASSRRSFRILSIVLMLLCATIVAWWW